MIRVYFMDIALDGMITGATDNKDTRAMSDVVRWRLKRCHLLKVAGGLKGAKCYIMAGTFT